MIKENIMQIGEALKDTRKGLGLSQTEMAGHILTKSYYSKIERGIHEINANDLIQILQLHSIDINDFFIKRGVEKKKISKNRWLDKLRQAYYNRDLEWIKKLEEKILDVKADKYNKEILREIITIDKAIISGNINNLPSKEISNIKVLLFKVENWNEENLRLFSSSIGFWTEDEVKPIMRSIVKKYSIIESYPRDEQIIVCSVLVNYLSYIVRNKNFSEDKKLVNEIFVLLKRLPVEPINCFGKIMKNFYQAYFDRNEKKIKEIIKFLANNNMEQIGEILKVSI